MDSKIEVITVLKGERYASERPEVIEQKRRLVKERVLTYKALVPAGLRKGKLASLAVAHST